ncbi:hypothetical protein [Actinacidiphila glaucinigra]|uniref:hypothetical protein n=1 Tax=Actinacidiphila glaucinigra TaxID=235986 RepID=UPI003D8A9E32
MSTDADGRARMWRDGTGPGELVLDQAALACFDLVPVLLRRALPHLASERAGVGRAPPRLSGHWLGIRQPPVNACGWWTS